MTGARRSTLRSRLLASAAAALLVLVAVAAPSSAQAPEAERSGDVLRLASQTPWVGPGEEFVLRLVATTDRPPDSVEVAVSVHPGVRSRTAFDESVAGRVRSTPITVAAVPLAELERDAAGAVTVRLPVQDRTQPPDRSRLRLPGTGVYPVRVELRGVDDREALESFTTHLLHVVPLADDAPELRVSVVLPVHAPLTVRPDGGRTRPDARLEALAGLADAVAGQNDVPVTIAPTPETIEALALSEREVDQATLAALSQVGAERTVLSPYVPLVLPAMLDADLDDEVRAQLARGREVLEGALGVRPDPTLRIVQGPLDAPSLESLRSQQADRLVVDEAQLEPLDLSRTLAQPFELDVAAPGRARAVGVDAGASSHFTSGAQPVLAAHLALAELSVTYSEFPGRPRGLVVMPPRSWAPDRVMLETFLTGLGASPVLRPVTASALFDEVPLATTGRDRPLVRRLAGPEDGAAPPAIRGAQFRAERLRVRSFVSVLEPGNPLAAQLEATLLAGQAADLRPAQRARYLAGVREQIDAQVSRIRMPSNRSITLPSRRGEIPITIQNELGYPIAAVLRVESDRLRFVDGSERPLELRRRNTTEGFTVQAQSSGSFPLRVRLESPDGRILFGQTRLTVRSTAVSGVGLVLSAAAGVFLVVWWARHLARGRRNRRLVPA